MSSVSWRCTYPSRHLQHYPRAVSEKKTQHLVELNHEVCGSLRTVNIQNKSTHFVYCSKLWVGTSCPKHQVSAHQEDSLSPREAIWSLLKLEHFCSVPKSPLKPLELLFLVSPSVLYVMSIEIQFIAILVSAERLSGENTIQQFLYPHSFFKRHSI